MSASPEIAALVDELDDAAYFAADALLTRSTTEWKDAKAARSTAHAAILAAIAKLETARSSVLALAADLDREAGAQTMCRAGRAMRTAQADAAYRIRRAIGVSK